MTIPTITFIIPVRDHRGLRGWDATCDRLKTTVASCMQQTESSCNVVVSAHPSTPLPDLPSAVQRVDYNHDPVPLPATNGADRYRAVRLDKGMRAMTGLIDAHDRGDYIMLVDYDDLVSRRIAGFLADEHGLTNDDTPSGYYVDAGYLFDDGPLALRLDHGFNDTCGTSLIVRRDLLRIPERVEDIDPEWSALCLGSHVLLRKELERLGTPLSPLPFAGAAYRIGYRGNTSRTPSVLRRSFTLWVLRHPRVLVDQVSRLRRRTALRPEFLPT